MYLSANDDFHNKGFLGENGAMMIHAPSGNSLMQSSNGRSSVPTPKERPAAKTSLYKKHTCEVCHKAFSRSNTLLTHKLAGVRFSQDYVHWPHLLPGQAILPPWTQDRRPAGAGCDIRRVLTPEEEALIPLQFNTHCGFVKQSLSQKTLGNVHSVSFSQGNGAPLSVDTSIPFPDFLRKLSESLRRTTKQNGVKSEALGLSPCVELQQTEPDSSCPDELVRTKSEVLNGHDVFKDSLEISNSERININGLEKEEYKKPDNNAFKHSGIYSIRDILGKHSTSQRGSQADTGCYQFDISSLPIGLPPAPECTFYGHSATRYKQMFPRKNYLGMAAFSKDRIHTGDKPFVCDLCGRAFRQPGNLTRHRLTHSAYKPFVCPVCRKAFN
uniref:C2H2-type domain-containing protein n=1 Tax=Biomphalaria glabrata TaxID=6526 RepID=A0A2C9LKR2_BIOGL